MASDYNDVIRESVSGYDFQPENSLVSHEATVKGTTYKKDMYVVINETDEGLIVGRIVMTVIHNTSVYFITELFQTCSIPDMGVHCLTPMNGSNSFVNQNDLLDYYPLSKYTVFDMSVIVLHHSFVSI